MIKKSFKDKVLKLVAKIPKGQTLSYKQVAQRAGSPQAYRAVGNILSRNVNTKIPCHRVICTSGSLGGYNRGQKRKKYILTKEKAKYAKRNKKI